MSDPWDRSTTVVMYGTPPDLPQWPKVDPQPLDPGASDALRKLAPGMVPEPARTLAPCPTCKRHIVPSMAAPRRSRRGRERSA